MVLAYREVQAILRALLGLLTQPFEQDLEAAVKGAATAIVLSGAFAAVSESTVIDASEPSLALVLVWLVATATLAKSDSRKLAISRSLSVISGWIASTLALVYASEQVYGEPVDRLEFVSVALLVLVPAHMARSLSVMPAIGMTAALWVSTGFLAWTLVY